MRNILINRSGVSIIAAIFIIVILAFMGLMFVTLIGTGSLSSVNDMQSAQAQYVAEGGIEYILENRAFPNYSMGGATLNLGAGSFGVSTPTFLTAAINIGNVNVNVNSTAGFAPAPGRIVIDNEVMAYNALGANSFTLAAGATAAHANGNAVYPVAQIAGVGLANNCAATDVQVGYVNNFTVPGIITIGNEYLYCTGTAAGPVRFTNCTRCYRGSGAAAHAIGDNVFQYMITSTGTVGNARRVAQAGVTRIAGGIAFDDKGDGRGNNVNSITWNHRTAGANLYLIVGVSIRNNAGQTILAPGGVTYAGADLAFLGAQNNGTNVRVELWGLANPALGNNNIISRLTGTETARMVGGSISFTGVDQAAPIDAAAVFATGNGIAPSVNINTVSNNAVVVDVMANLMNANAAVGAGQAEQWNRNSVGGGGGTHIRGAGSYEGPISPPGNVNMSWGLSAVQEWAIGAVALRPAPGSGAAVLDWREVVQ